MAKKKRKGNKQNFQNGGGKPNVGRTPFQKLCRDLSALLKIVHHHIILVNSKSEGLPRAFKQKVEELGKFLKPAHPNPDLAQDLNTLATSWGSQVRDRLLAHYTDEIQKLEASIQNQTEVDLPNFETATQVALNWAKARMKKKLTQETKTAFLQRVTRLKPKVPNTPPVPTAPIQMDNTPRQIGQKAKRDQRSPEVASPGTSSPPSKQQASGSPQGAPRDASKSNVVPTPGKRERETSSPGTSPSPSQSSKNPRTDMGSQGASPDFSWRDVGRPKRPVKLGRMDSVPASAVTPPKSPQTDRPTYVQAAASPPREMPIPTGGRPVHTASFPARVHKAQGGLSHDEKMDLWRIKPADKSANTLILGTSNVARITTKPRRDIELQSFPGGRFAHMKEMLKKLPIQDEPRRVVVAMGINDSSSQTPLQVIKKEIRETAVLAKSRFPHSEVYFAEINHSKMMEPTKKQRTLALNQEIRELSAVKFIPKMNCNRVSICKTDSSKVHWNTDTANNIVRHWASELN